MSNDNELYTGIGVAALAVVASLAKTSQWLDPKTGRVNFGLLIGGVSTALVLAMCVFAAGQHYGVEPLAQAAVTGVLCYVGPDAIIRAAAQMILKRAGVNINGITGNDVKP